MNHEVPVSLSLTTHATSIGQGELSLPSKASEDSHYMLRGLVGFIDDDGTASNDGS